MEKYNQVVSLFGERSLQAQFSVEGQPDFIFLNQVHWFVPCRVIECDIVLEKPYESKLNCFETAVLRLLDLSSGEPSALAELLCFQGEDFVHLLLSDLQDYGMIGKDYKVLAPGKQEIQEQQERAKSLAQASALVFQNLYTGSLMPFVDIQSPLEHPKKPFYYEGNLLRRSKQEKGEEMSCSFGTSGKKKELRGEVLPRTGVLAPTEQEVKAILSQFQKKAPTTQGGWSIATEYLGGSIPTAQQNQRVYFHVQGGKTVGDAEQIVISDGFMPVLVDMVDYISKKDSQRLEALHSGAIVARSQVEGGIVYENERYPQLKGAWCQPLEGYDQSKDGEKALDSAIRQGIGLMYGELEWGFYYYFAQHPVSDQALLPSLSREERKEVLEQVLDQKEIPQGKVDLISQFSGKNWKAGMTPKMTQMLPLLLLQWREGESALLSRLQEELPHFYRDLSYLHPLRNKALHQGQNRLSLGQYEKYQKMAEQLLVIILPDWKRTRYIRKQINENNSDSNRRLLAMERLHQEFGFGFVHHYLSPEMKEAFLEISPENRHVCGGEDYIKALALLLELCFAREIQGRSMEQGKEWKEYQLPQSLTTVKEEALQKALQGHPSTLGAEVLAFLQRGEKEKVQRFLAVDGLAVVDIIIGLRGHGNGQMVSPVLLEEENLQTLRQGVVRVMKGMEDHGQKEEE